MFRHPLIILFVSLLNLTNIQSLSKRRVFYGSPHSEFNIPYSSVVTIRSSDANWKHFCSGVLVNPRSVITTAVCMQEKSSLRLRIGYGSTIIDQQKLIDVSYYNLYDGIDASMLRLKDRIPSDNKIQFFTMSLWSLDILSTVVKNQTFMCGYGMFEGPDKNIPKGMVSKVLRCHAYEISGNYETIYKMANTSSSQWPLPISGMLNFPHDKRYMSSISRAPQHRLYKYFSTSCLGDAGGPVFRKGNDGSYQLQGIHHSGPGNCGNASDAYIYDDAVLMKAIYDVQLDKELD